MAETTPSDSGDAGVRDARRLHPLTLGFRFAGHVKNLLVPAAAVLLFSEGERWQIWLAVLFVPALLLDVLHYLTFRYVYREHELVVRHGWLFKQERHVPYARIQNVDTSEGPLQRLCGVVEARLETAGGAEPEARLQVVGRAAVEELRARIVAGRQRAGVAPDASADPGEAAARHEEVLLRLGVGDLLRLALDPGRGLALLFVIWGLAWEFDLFERFGLFERLDAWTRELEEHASLIEALTLLGTAIAALFLLSLAGVVLALHGFTLAREGDVFHVRRGLLTRQHASIPVRRIQVVTVRESWMHRLMGRAKIQVGTAGGRPGEHEQQGGNWFAPLVRRDRVAALLAAVDPRMDWGARAWRRRSPRAGRRLLRAALIAAALPGVAAGLIFAPWGWIALPVLLGLAAAGAFLEHRFAAWDRPDDALWWRDGAWNRRTSVTLDEKVQAAALRDHPLDRRWGMRTLRVDTAGAGRTGHRFRIAYLEESTARALRDEVAAGAARSRFRW